jgi:hypothetical protein
MEKTKLYLNKIQKVLNYKNFKDIKVLINYLREAWICKKKVFIF